MRNISPSGYRVIVKCDGCGKEFIKIPYLLRPTNYCSLPCYHSSSKRKQNHFCIKCGKSFQIKKYLIDQGYGQYCSRKCQHSDYPQQVEIVCKECRNKFTKPPSQAKLSIYCSKKCHDLAMSDFETRTCAHCHREFQIPTWETKKGKGKFCTRECFIKFNGESSLEEKVRNYLEYKHVSFKQEVKFGRYRADFLLTNTKIIIECDGEFWHLRPQSKIRDKRKDKYLYGLGYKVFRLTGRQINENLAKSMSKFVNIEVTRVSP